MINKFETVGIAVSIGLMVLALYFIRLETTNETLSSVSNTDQSASVFIAEGENKRAAVADAVVDASSISGNLEKLIIDDVVKYFSTNSAKLELGKILFLSL